jgi:hypothetical protein
MPEWTWECRLVPPYVRRKPLLVALKRPSDSGIFEGFSWSVQGRDNFRSAHASAPIAKIATYAARSGANSGIKEALQIHDLSAVLNLKLR